MPNTQLVFQYFIYYDIGQAFVIFKKKEAAESVVRKLEEGCFLMSNGRYVLICICLITALTNNLNPSMILIMHKHIHQAWCDTLT